MRKKKTLPVELQLEIDLKPVFDRVGRLVRAQLEEDGFFKALKEFDDKRKKLIKKHRKQFEKELDKARGKASSKKRGKNQR